MAMTTVDADSQTALPRSSAVTYESDDPGAALGGQRTSPPRYVHHRRGSVDWTKTSTTISTCSDAAGKLQIAETSGVVRHHARQAR